MRREAGREALAVRDQPERHGHRRIPGLGQEAAAAAADEQQRIEPLATSSAHRRPRRRPAAARARGPTRSGHGPPASPGPARPRCPSRSGRTSGCPPTHARGSTRAASVSDRTGAAGPRLASQAAKSRLKPYFSTTEQSASAPLRPALCEHEPFFIALRSGSFASTLGGSAASTTVAPRSRSTATASSSIRFWSVRDAAARLRIAGQHDRIDEPGARHADPRAPQRVGPQEPRVVAAGRRRAARGRRVRRIGRRALEHAEHDGGIGHAARHRPGGVLVERDRHDTVAADPPDGRLDRREHGRGRGTDDRHRGLGADVRGPQAQCRTAARRRAARREHRSAIVEARARVTARIIGIERIAAERRIVVRHADDHPVGHLGHHRLGDDDRARVAQVASSASPRRAARIPRSAACRPSSACRSVWMLSFSATGMPCSGPRSRPAARSRSSASACSSARGLTASVGVHPVLVERDPREVLRRRAPAS